MVVCLSKDGSECCPCKEAEKAKFINHFIISFVNGRQNASRARTTPSPDPFITQNEKLEHTDLRRANTLTKHDLRLLEEAA